MGSHNAPLANTSASLVDILKPPTPADLKRESMLLMASHGSVYAAEIGEAVPVAMKEAPTYVEEGLSRLASDATVAERKKTEERLEGRTHDADGAASGSAAVPRRTSNARSVASRHSAADSESTSAAGSVFSEGQVPLGRLNTVTRKPHAAPPAMSLRTGVDSTIPPRLKRRPVSEMLTRPVRASLRHRLSLDISQDLDMLMATATHLLSPEMAALGFGGDSLGGALGSALRPRAAHNVSVPYSSQKVSMPAQAVQAQAVQPHAGQPQAGQAPAVQSAPAVQPQTVQAPAVQSAPAVQPPAQPAASPLPPLERGPSCLSSTDSFLTAETAPSLPVALPKRPTADNMQRARQASQKWAGSDISEQESQATFSRASNRLDSPNTPRHDTPPHSYYENRDAPSTHSASPTAAAFATQFEAAHSSSPSGPGAPQANEPRVQHAAPQYSHTRGDSGEWQDDGFYDEPVVMTGPARAKSVKESTRPQRHRSKARHSKSAGKMRPFSYNTLINLLESINGTVVGEEFELLNLPVKEKQLIEKIIDLLSRLTLDMVIDETRYDAGIGRLEKAHRALEGFL